MPWCVSRSTLPKPGSSVGISYRRICKLSIGGAWTGAIGRGRAVQHTFTRAKWKNEAGFGGGLAETSHVG